MRTCRRQHVGPVEEVGDAAEALGLALREVLAVQPQRLAVVARRVAFEAEAREHARLGEVELEAQRDVAHRPGRWPIVDQSGCRCSHAQS
jgi:hypothetical protein